MSNNKAIKQDSKATTKKPLPQPSGKAPTDEFIVSSPYLWLALAAILVYIVSLSFGYTELDDSIFIRDFREYNEQLSNLATSFQRGLFDAVKDPYYRPLFSDSIILNYQVSNVDILGYHIVNIVLHLISVLLVYKLFLRLGVKELTAFILALVFAVHPVLSQAVAWVPGRNDTLLAVFVLSYLIYAIDYSNRGKIWHLALSATFLLLAFFTKETAVFAPPVAFVLLVFVLNKKWNDKRNLLLYAKSIGVYAVWFIARSMATTVSSGIASKAGITEALRRLPVLVQYLGKIFFPFNLSVFPTQEDTVYCYGVAAIVFLIFILFMNKQRNMRVVLSGFAVFLLFLMPALLVPTKLNGQTFEHRLYLPILGILLLLPQTILFQNKLTDRQLFRSALVVCGIFAAINIYHQQSFASPRAFWTQAVETSPNSAYANMMLGARLDKDETTRSEDLFRKAYQLNPNEKYLNFYIGELLQKKDSVAASEKYLLAEKNISNYYLCDFMLARVDMERKDFNGAINYLEAYLKHDTKNSMANNNLLLLYMQTQQPDKARAHIKQMQQMGLQVPAALAKQLGM